MTVDEAAREAFTSEYGTELAPVAVIMAAMPAQSGLMRSAHFR